MEKLPTEVQSIILGYLDKEDLLSSRQVNRTWQTLSEEHLKNFRFSVMDDMDIEDLLEVLSWRKSANNTLSSPFVRFSIDNVFNIDPMILKQFATEFANVVQDLVINEQWTEYSPKTHSEPIFQFLQTLTNLKKLRIKFHKINSSKSLNSELTFSFPYLTSLELRKIYDEKSLLNIINSSPRLTIVKFETPILKRKKGNNNWISLLQLLSDRNIEVTWKCLPIDRFSIEEFKHLVNIPLKMSTISLVIDTEYRRMKNVRHLQNLIQQLIKNNCETLRLFKIFMVKGSKKFEISLPKLEELESIKLGGFLNLLNIMPAINQNTLPSLKKLRLETYDSCDILTTLTDKTLKIEALKIRIHQGSSKLVENLNQLIESKAQYLKFLTIADYSSEVAQFINFPRIESLRSLNIEGRISDQLKSIFENLTGIEELLISTDEVFAWEVLTAVPEVEDFLNKDCLNPMTPTGSNLGNMNVLKRFTFVNDEINQFQALKAIAYLVSCGKLKNLKHIELGVKDVEKVASFLPVFKSKGIKFIPAESIQSSFNELLGEVQFLETQNRIARNGCVCV